jgi:hypothetical protein
MDESKIKINIQYSSTPIFPKIELNVSCLRDVSTVNALHMEASGSCKIQVIICEHADELFDIPPIHQAAIGMLGILALLDDL